MGKAYSDRSMKGAQPGEELEFFFPKNVPPVTIKARTREEAEEKLAALNSKEA